MYCCLLSDVPATLGAYSTETQAGDFEDLEDFEEP